MKKHIVKNNIGRTRDTYDGNSKLIQNFYSETTGREVRPLRKSKPLWEGDTHIKMKLKRNEVLSTGFLWPRDGVL
jgi:hypothetical protein